MVVERIEMFKKATGLLLITVIIPFVSACQPAVQIKSESGALGHRADLLKQYASGSHPVDTSVEMKNNVIYMGKEYENNTFGPGKIRFVFE